MTKKRTIGKRKKKKKAKTVSAPPPSAPQLRFKVGDVVECKLGQNLYESGKVTAIWWRDPSWPAGRVAPYQVKLDKRNVLIFVPRDDMEVIRRPGEVFRCRFDVGHRVLCKVNREPERWEAGVIIAHKFPYPQNPKIIMPYQIKLDIGQMIFAPRDDDDCIKEDVDRVGEPMSAEDARLLQGGERRFKVGDRVVCKINPDPEIWEPGTVTKVDMTHPSNDQVQIPYQVRLDENNALIFAPADSDDVIRHFDKMPKLDKNQKRRFTLGSRVECKIHHQRDDWMAGKITALNVKDRNVIFPYKIKLDNGKTMYAPVDRNEIIRAEPKNELEYFEELMENVEANETETKQLHRKDPSKKPVARPKPEITSNHKYSVEQKFEEVDDFLDLD